MTSPQAIEDGFSGVPDESQCPPHIPSKWELGWFGEHPNGTVAEFIDALYRKWEDFPSLTMKEVGEMPYP